MHMEDAPLHGHDRTCVNNNKKAERALMMTENLR